MASSPEHEHESYDDSEVYGSYADLQALPVSNVAWSLVPEDDPRNAEHPFDEAPAGRYKDPQVIAVGGMGRVSAVTDTRLKRQVAMKEVRPDEPDAARLERRLAQEAFITAQLEHPGIVPVHDAGESEQGRLFFTMRLLRGQSLAQVLAERSRPRDTLLRHFLTVCQAMAYAHAVGIVHRDLKPANIMLGEFGETQICDWGVAALLTDQTAGRVGTPAYMSPEQARGQAASRASDVWSLGAVLFEMLAGRPPFEGLTTDAIYAQLERGAAPRLLNVAPGVSSELAAIVDCALAAEPGQRYAEAQALAADVEAYLDGRRVDVYSYSAWDMARRFGRAFRLPLAIGAIALVVTGVVFGLSYSQTLDERDRAKQAERGALEARDRARSAERTATDALARADANFARVQLQRAIEAQYHDAEVEAQLLAAQSLKTVETPRARGVLARYALGSRPYLSEVAVPPRCVKSRLSPDGSSMLCLQREAVSLWSCSGANLIWTADHSLEDAVFASETLVLAWHKRQTVGLDVATGAMIPVNVELFPARAKSASGVVLGDATDQLLVWRQATNHARYLLGAPSRPPWAISGDGKVALTYDDVKRRPYRVDLDTAEVSPMAMLPWRDEGPVSAALDRKGRRAAFGSNQGGLAVVDVRTGATLWRARVTHRSLTDVKWSPDDHWLSVRDERGWVSLHHAADGRARLAIPRVEVGEVAWRQRGKALELVTYGPEIRIYRMPDTLSANRYMARAGIATLTLDAAGRRLALPDGGGSVGLFEVAGGRRLGEIGGDNAIVAKHVAFESDSEHVLVSWPGRGELSRWRVGGARVHASQVRHAKRIFIAANGDRYALAYGPLVYRLRGTSESDGFRAADAGIPVNAVMSRDGRALVWVSSRGGVERLPIGGDRLGKPEMVTSLARAIRVAVDQDASVIAVANPEEVRVVSGPDWRESRVHRVPGMRISEVALSPDGQHTAVGTMDGEVWYWDATDSLRMVGAGHAQRVSGLEFGPGGDWFISASWDAKAIRWGLSILDESPERTLSALRDWWGVGVDHAMGIDRR